MPAWRRKGRCAIGIDLAVRVHLVCNPHQQFRSEDEIKAVEGGNRSLIAEAGSRAIGHNSPTYQ